MEMVTWVNFFLVCLRDWSWVSENQNQLKMQELETCLMCVMVRPFHSLTIYYCTCCKYMIFFFAQTESNSCGSVTESVSRATTHNWMIQGAVLILNYF